MNYIRILLYKFNSFIMKTKKRKAEKLTKKQLLKIKGGLEAVEEKLNSIGDDAQLASIGDDAQLANVDL